MKSINLIITLLILTLTSSCVEKQPNVLAIDVLLTLPEGVYDQAIQLNQAILEKHPDNFTLDENHIPHITLLQCYIVDSDLPKVEQLLNGLYKTIEKDSLWADHLQYNKDKPESFASIGIEKSKTLITIHKKAIALLEPYIITNGTQEAYVQNADGSLIDQFTIDYVPKFVSHYSYENFNPHISLGVAKTALLDSLEQNSFRPTKFQATGVSVYQLGNYGTARKLLWEEAK